MKATELRVGNWLDLGSQGQTDINGFMLYVYDLSQRRHCGTNPEWTKEVKPIPLTAEWLVKFSASKFPSGKNTWSIGNKSTRLLEWMDCRQVFIDQATSTELKYVHQLQNLYFALTNTELTLTEPLADTPPSSKDDSQCQTSKSDT